ncbi:hypothetical protein AA101099_1883 [Neoasaia chiangmaiensis NBRC 101099]|uniref:Uncharacterized protein n=1 Tax=Neoasaia chiangmaiensis TaxID=320497 RepID=A0A1U9KQT7_9PROT|nr:hypothetical protein [Neoasaia chiangmaiensis]AQS88173.1 hypothetical protein A0U93_09735 [Neoasaia chiangmaiensis]GBR39933.1 hypothetical protein AA101099_1883 [Neoasaia chiangmaiensis NBRC 101099]GEN14807.1 hypothetical protein NCH01_12380 [Neoasaia chiangmaiensis]
MNAALITAIVQGVVAAAEEVPNIVEVIEEAIAASKSGTGPTNDQIASAVTQAQATNAAIQSS